MNVIPIVDRRRAHFIAESDQSDTETEMKKDVKQGRGQNTLQDDLCTEDNNDNGKVCFGGSL